MTDGLRWPNSLIAVDARLSFAEINDVFDCMMSVLLGFMAIRLFGNDSQASCMRRRSAQLALTDGFIPVPA